MALACLASSSQVIAAESEPQTCELHVWPSSGLGSVYYGWAHGGIVNGAVTGREGYPPVPGDALDVPRQVSVLTDTHPEQLLGFPAYGLVVHTESLPSRVMRTQVGRLVESSPGCYAELVVDTIIFQQDIFTGRYLKALIRLRQFDDTSTAPISFATWVQTRIETPQPKSPAEEATLIAELANAYRNDLKLFSDVILKRKQAPAKKEKK